MALLLALLPFAPVWGWVCFGGLAGVVVHLRDAWRGFSSLGWLAGCSPGSLPFCFEQLVSMQGASCFLRLAWRYGRCFWRRPFPYPWCFPDAGSNVSVSTFLGWFTILEVIVLKSRVSRFSWSLTLLAWCLEFWVPYPVAPFRGWLSGSSVRCVGLAELHRTSGLVLQSLCSLLTCYQPGLWGDPCLGVQWLSFRVRVLCPLLRRVDVALRDLPCSSVGGLHCPGPVSARIIAWENVFSLG